MVNYKFHGQDCILVKNTVIGHYCGYVVVPQGINPDLLENVIDVHGGITYNDIHHYGKHKGKRVVGFDCAHAGDIDIKFTNGGFIQTPLVKREQARQWLKEMALQVRIIELLSKGGDMSLLGLKTVDRRRDLLMFLEREYESNI